MHVVAQAKVPRLANANLRKMASGKPCRHACMIAMRKLACGVAKVPIMLPFDNARHSHHQASQRGRKEMTQKGKEEEVLVDWRDWLTTLAGSSSPVSQSWGKGGPCDTPHFVGLKA